MGLRGLFWGELSLYLNLYPYSSSVSKTYYVPTEDTDVCFMHEFFCILRGY